MRRVDGFLPMRTLGSVRTEILDTMADPKQVLRMYRRLLKLAQQYPSIKRQSIIKDVKTEFRANRYLSDAPAIRQELAAVQAGIKELSMYASLHPSLPNWTIEVGHDAAPSSFEAQVDEDTKVVH